MRKKAQKAEKRRKTVQGAGVESQPGKTGTAYRGQSLQTLSRREKVEVGIGDIHLELPAVNLELCSDIEGSTKWPTKFATKWKRSRRPTGGFAGGGPGWPPPICMSVVISFLMVAVNGGVRSWAKAGADKVTVE